MCLYPTLILNRKYTATKKNGGVIPAITDPRVKYVPIGCQRCIECTKQKARSWQLRLLEDIKKNKNGKFVTLTLSNEQLQYIVEGKDTKGKQITEPLTSEGYQLDNEIATIATRRFLERWRKRFRKSARHFFVTELGHEGTENIHIHGIIWTNETFDTIREIWEYGFIWPRKEEYRTNYVNAQTVNYIIKYITKRDELHPTYQSKILTSPGIGRNYTSGYDWKQNKFNGTKTNELYRTSTGHQIALPMYWRNKIYSEQEREKLWLQRLDKNERWICGEQVKADDDKAYYALLKWHRARNKRLGYGSDEKNWQQEQYEITRRKLMQAKRLAKGQKNTTSKKQKTKELEEEKERSIDPKYQNTIKIGYSIYYATDQGLQYAYTET